MDKQTAQEAFDLVAKSNRPIGEISSFICPYPDCRTYAVHRWGSSWSATFESENRSSSRSPGISGVVIALSYCEACKRDAVFIDGKLAKPRVGEAPPPTPDTPPEILSDLNEAAHILPDSPRGAAALLRLALQKLLPLLGAKKAEINVMIGELVASGAISPAIQQALDSVRVIGNEAVHPGVMDLKDDVATAMALFRLINFIIEKCITEPKEVAAIYASLPPGKLAGIAARDAKSGN